MSFYNIQKKNSLTEKSLMALLLLAKTCVCVCVCVCVCRSALTAVMFKWFYLNKSCHLLQHWHIKIHFYFIFLWIYFSCFLNLESNCTYLYIYIIFLYFIFVRFIYSLLLFLVVGVFLAARGLFLAAAGGKYPSLCPGFSLLWVLLGAQDLGSQALGVAAHRLRSCGSKPGARLLWHMGLVAPWHMESFWTRDWTGISCIVRLILGPGHWINREAPCTLSMCLIFQKSIMTLCFQGKNVYTFVQNYIFLSYWKVMSLKAMFPMIFQLLGNYSLIRLH